MARPRKSASELALTGAFSRNPARKRKDPPGAAGGPILQINRTPETCFRELVTLAPANVLTASDAASVEIAAHLLADFRVDPDAFQASKLRILVSLLSNLGFDPQGRRKLAIPEQEPDAGENPWAKFQRGL